LEAWPLARTLDIEDVIEMDRVGVNIANMYTEWEMQRNQWLAEKTELRHYLFATDTSQTSNNALPWKNSVHIPKLCQIRDNLHANYMAALFPHDRPIKWEGDDESSEAKDKRQIIEAYMENKLRQGMFRTEVSKAVYDFIDYGNAFGMTQFVAEETTDSQTEEKIPGFVGPKFIRISPLDIVFNPTAATFASSPKIVRSLKTLGDLRSDMQDHPEMGYLEPIFKKMLENRKAVDAISQGDSTKNSAFSIDGFDHWMNYFKSDYVELLDFYGDIYEKETDTLYKNKLITVVDRSLVLRDITNPSWLGNNTIHHVGWRLRPDNLYAMGPLDNLVGMQYRIDHLENAKADGFDLIVQPVMKIKGFVEDFDYGPGERIYSSEEGDVEFMHPDTTFLNADTQIQILEQKMEEMAGAPKQAMGLRTPGEKTAYEVQILENGANRIFVNKTSYFEEMFLEPLINAMLETARRNMGVSDLIRVTDDQYGVVDFMKITKEDITARGKIRPIGARHFARNANIIQNLTQLASSAIGQDPSVLAHISGKKMAHLIEELLGLERYGLVTDNIRVSEQLETAKLGQAGQQILMEGQAPDGTANPMVQPPQGQAGAGAV
jgi:hypothetical protein